MRRGVRLLVVFSALFSSACTTYSLEELRQVEPKGSEFNKALTRHYLEFAESEAKEYDWADSMWFADKGLISAYGGEVGPEELSDWKIGAEFLPDMEKARADLLAALTPAAIEAHPENAAAAQFYFDCWVEQQEEAWQQDDIDACRDAFNDNLAGLAAPAPKAITEKETTTYVVFFDYGQSKLNAKAKKVVAEVAAAVKPDEEYDIVLNGHTDASGSQKHNLKLSQKRAESVKAGLVEKGVKADAIKIFAYGESDLKVKGKNKKNAKSEANRRVEIILTE